MIPSKDPFTKILIACQQRAFSSQQTNAYRLFNGYYEGLPGLVVDRYGETLVVLDHKQPGRASQIISSIAEWGINNLPGIHSVLLKQRQSQNKEITNGVLIAGNTIAQTIKELGVAYAIDLQINQDASFYLDTRNLREWLMNHSEGRNVLNTFAYTGSLGVVAGVGGASKVIQTDLNPDFLDLARKSWLLNALNPEKSELLPGDFFRVAGRLRHSNRLFGCVILDPPFFSTTEAGKVDLQGEISRLINKVRPLVAHEGWLVVINNALFVSGRSFMEDLQSLCESPYLSFEKIIPIPADVTGYPNTIVDSPPVDPAPFNHPTKIAILKVSRKDERK